MNVSLRDRVDALRKIVRVPVHHNPLEPGDLERALRHIKKQTKPAPSDPLQFRGIAATAQSTIKIKLTNGFSQGFVVNEDQTSLPVTAPVPASDADIPVLEFTQNPATSKSLEKATPHVYLRSAWGLGTEVGNAYSA
jgi:hypothetical protein